MADVRPEQNSICMSYYGYVVELVSVIHRLFVMSFSVGELLVQ